jgi:hypothetical protein
MNFTCGGANLLVNKSEGSLYNILRSKMDKKMGGRPAQVTDICGRAVFSCDNANLSLQQ